MNRTPVTDEVSLAREFDTFNGWAERGFVVRKGQRGKWVNPQGETIFHISQIARLKTWPLKKPLFEKL